MTDKSNLISVCRLIILRLTRLVLICLTVIMVMDRIYAYICYNSFNITATEWAFFRIPFRVAPFLLITALFELLYNHISSRPCQIHYSKIINYVFCFIKAVLIIWALIYWSCSVNKHYAEYLNTADSWYKDLMKFEEPSAVSVSEKFGMIITFVYLSEFLIHCGFRIYQALAQQKIMRKKPCEVISTVFGSPTTKEIILRVLEVSFFVFAFLKSINFSMNKAPYQMGDLLILPYATFAHGANHFDWFLDTLFYAPYNNLCFLQSSNYSNTVFLMINRQKALQTKRLLYFCFFRA